MHERLANLLGATSLNVADLALAEIRQSADVGDSASAALVALAESPGLATTDLGRRIGLSQPAAARMVDGLLRRGLVERRTRTGRAVAVHLTRAGRLAAQRLLERRARIVGELLDELDADEQAVLAGLLEKVLHAVYGRIEATGREPATTGDLVCRLCDRAACREEGAPCPVTQARLESTGEEGNRHG